MVDRDPGFFERRALAAEVGQSLIKSHGKKAYYPVSDVVATARQLQLPGYLDSWVLALFTARKDFYEHQRDIGESFNYDAMREAMIMAVQSDAPPREAASHETFCSTADIFLDILAQIDPFDIGL